MAKEKELTSQETAKLRRREREVEDRLGDNLYHGSNLMLALLAVPEVDRVRILEIFSRELVPESLAEIGEYLASKKKEPDIIEGLLLILLKKPLVFHWENLLQNKAGF